MNGRETTTREFPTEDTTTREFPTEDTTTREIAIEETTTREAIMTSETATIRDEVWNEPKAAAPVGVVR